MWRHAALAYTLLTATGVLTLAIALRYCQTATLIVRGTKQYQTEDNVVGPLLHENIYRREGKIHLNEYPLLLYVAWFVYVILFPAITMIAAASLAGWEWFKLPYQLLHRIADALIALAIVVFFFLYRVQPFVSQRWSTWEKRKEDGKRKRLAA